jgi:putative redox protein
MTHTVETSWKGNMQFDALVSGHHVMMDASTEFGGENAGCPPKQLLLAALTGCTGMDVVEILKKMRVKVDKFDLEVKADATDSDPKVYTKMHLIYKLQGTDISLDKVKKAVALSQEKYCGVSAMLRKAMEVTYEIQLG